MMRRNCPLFPRRRDCLKDGKIFHFVTNSKGGCRKLGALNSGTHPDGEIFWLRDDRPAAGANL
jgi:hypothetical protein